MKKVLTTVAVLALVSTVNAQMTVGGKAGLNYTIISTKIDPEPDEKPESGSGIGFHVGGFLEFGISDKIGIRPELLYSVRGFQEDEKSSTSTTVGGIVSTTETTAENKSSYSYLEIPLLLAYKASDNFSIHVGPGFGLLMGGKVKSSGDTKTTIVNGGQTTTSTAAYDAELSGSDVTDGLRGMEIGGVIGAGYQAEGGLGFNLRYWRGLTTVNEETEFFGTTVKSNANLIQLSVTYAFIKD